jgi:hypothetical protein
VYTSWVGMQWPPTHRHTAALEKSDGAGNMYVYTDRGYMRGGIWEPTGQLWVKGVCVTEFKRVCTATVNGTSPSLLIPVDLASGLTGVMVQDTDVAYRPRVTYTNFTEIAQVCKAHTIVVSEVTEAIAVAADTSFVLLLSLLLVFHHCFSLIA